VHFIAGVKDELPHQRAKVDLVFVAALLYHVTDPLFLLRTAANACRDLSAWTHVVHPDDFV
jgi:hypothetical protein